MRSSERKRKDHGGGQTDPTGSIKEIKTMQKKRGHDVLEGAFEPEKRGPHNLQNVARSNSQ